MKQVNEGTRSLQVALIGLVVVVAVLFIIGMYVYKPEPVTLQGEAEVSEVRVSGKVPGRIVKFLVEEGDPVKAGDTLVVIDSPELTAKLEQAQAAKDAALAQNRKAQKGARQEMIAGAYEMWQKAEAGADIAQKSFDRVQRLYDRGVIPAQKRDEAEAQYKAAVATTRAARSQYEMAVNGAETEDKDAARALVNRAQGAIREVEAYLGETVLVAPADGEVSEIFPQRGELVGTGAPILNIIDLNDIWFAFNIREDLLGELKMGSVFTAAVPALNNQSVDLKVTAIKPMASFATWKATKATGQFDAKTFEVKARPVTPVKDLRPGMSAILQKVIR
ncbi:MAG TPA: efflux RND transporter periplasmic adaptor subunit [Prolixibacteraceae bacterium]|mgnify:CR=1 FL=1|nr:efflux RND transporter periplasmic adaptor subunit [Prolixibacteraceae bacterium]